MESSSIIKAYTKSILNRRSKTLEECLDYYKTVNSNIRLFMKDKTNVMAIYLDEAEKEFPEFWKVIGAEGDFEKAVEEFRVQYNDSDRYTTRLFRNGVLKVKNLFR